MTDPLAVAFNEALAKPAGPIPASFAEDYAVELAAIARRVLAAEHVARLDEIDRLRADLAALVKVAAGAVSDETAGDPGVMALMRFLAANYPAEPSTTVTSGSMAVELPGIEPDKVVDLMAALEQSIAAAKEARARRPRPAERREDTP